MFGGLSLIKNITKLSFANYGTISSIPYDDIQLDDVKNETTKIITTFDLNSYFIDTTNKTVINIEEGTAVLYTYTPGNDSRSFFLDKCVILNPNVFYKVVPLDNSCTIKIKFNNKTTSIQRSNTHIDFSRGIKSKLNIAKIYTLYYQEFDKFFSYKGEKHDFWEITYVDQGELSTLIDGREFILKQGDFIFYAPNQYHTQKNNSSVPVSFLTISFKMDFEEEDILKDKIFICDHELKSILEKILDEKNYNGVYSPDLIICYLKEFIVKLIRIISKKNSIKQLHTSMQVNTNNAFVNTSLEYIYSHISQKITVDELADKVSISSSYLSRIFKDVMGVTIIDYINNYRLDTSKVYIKSTDLSLTQIAEILGFNSIHYFSKQFKKRYGISPIVYSKSLKN